MKYLLDTHSFIWTITDVKKLSKNARQIIEDSNNEVGVSVVTFWEISIKKSIGKISFGKFMPEDFVSMANRSQFTIIGLAATVAATAYRLPWRKDHNDPFDRMLVWKAIQNDFHLVSKDSDFSLYKDLGLKLIW